MRIVHLNAVDTGGAGRAVARLCVGLRRLGHDASMVVAQGGDAGPHVSVLRSPGPTARFARRLRWERIRRDFRAYEGSRPPGHTIFSDDRSPIAAELADELPPADVVHLHWVAGVVDYGAFFPTLPAGVAVAWTLHDMNPFTGGCHYDLGCGRFESGCGACPQLGSADDADLSRRVFERKREALGRLDAGRLSIVTPSRWLAGLARRSPLLGRFAATVIPNGVDGKVFAPCDRGAARARLSLPADAPVVLYVGGAAALLHKGFPHLVAALQRLGLAGAPLLLSAGSGVPDVDPAIPHVRLGAVDSDERLALAYNAADVCACPSVQDNFPNVVLESLACGTPVAAFDAGGLPDAVRPGLTGWLAAAGNASALADAIARALNGRASAEPMRAQCRKVAVEEYSLEAQARRHELFYQELLTHRRSPGGAAP